MTFPKIATIKYYIGSLNVFPKRPDNAFDSLAKMQALFSQRMTDRVKSTPRNRTAPSTPSLTKELKAHFFSTPPSLFRQDCRLIRYDTHAMPVLNRRKVEERMCDLKTGQDVRAYSKSSRWRHSTETIELPYLLTNLPRAQIIVSNRTETMKLSRVAFLFGSLVQHASTVNGVSSTLKGSHSRYCAKSY